MRLVAGSGHSKLCVLSLPPFMQARHKIAWQERTIAGGAEHPFRLRSVRCGPVERGEDAGERAREAGHAVRNDVQTERIKPRRIAIGVRSESVALRRQTRD